MGRREQDRWAYKPPRRRAFEAPFTLKVGLALASLGGCTYEQEGPPEAHFENFGAKPPKLDTLSRMPCLSLQGADVARVARDDSPAEERRAIAYAIAWMERQVALTVGTATDRPSVDFGGSGDPTQQDCVDEATNTTSYLLVLERYGLIRHHIVERPFAKDSLVHCLLGGAHPREGKPRAFCHRFTCRRQWREPHGAGSRKLLRAR